MRIIAGDMKGRRLNAPNDTRVRPTSDKVKGAVFSMIVPHIENAIVVDLFAGTGNLGLEALSRGADLCFFADKSRDSFNLITQNIELCRAKERSRMFCGDFDITIDRISKDLENMNKKADIILLDPPYGYGYIDKCLIRFNERNLLAQDGVIVAEHGIEEDINLESTPFRIQKVKRYGKIGITILTQNLEENDI